MAQHNGDIEVDGQQFDIDRIAKSKSDRRFILTISVTESTTNIPRTELETELNIYNRHQITKELIETRLQKWAKEHPELTINSFTVVEEVVARHGTKITS